MKKYTAELLGTFVLTLFGCGSAAIAGASLGTLGIAFAFGLSIVAMAYAIGDISGCHINPAVSLGVWMSGKMSGKDFAGYVIAQFIGATLAALVLMLIINATNLGGINVTGLGANGYGAAKNAILIVEFAKDERAHGASVEEAALDGLTQRFRPVLMTAFTFILGMLPMVFATGAGAASRRALGVPVFYGMLVGTMAGLFLIPLFYVLIQSLVDKWTNRKRKKKA